MACIGTALPFLVYTVQRLPSSIIGAGTTHHVRTFTTKLVDQFLTTSVVISDTPAGHIFTEDHPQLQWCLWMFSVFICPCTHGKGTFTLCCTVAASFCLHTVAHIYHKILVAYIYHKILVAYIYHKILVAYIYHKILNRFCVFMWWTCTTYFIYKEF
jgi:hypothetical protein